MTVTMSAHPDEGWVELGVSGRVTEADVRRVLARLDGLVAARGTVCAIEVIAGFEGYDLGAIRPGLASEYRHLTAITHAAVVCDIGWLGPVSRTVGAVTPLNLRLFSGHDRDAARGWAAALKHPPA